MTPHRPSLLSVMILSAFGAGFGGMEPLPRTAIRHRQSNARSMGGGPPLEPPSDVPLTRQQRRYLERSLAKLEASERRQQPTPNDRKLRASSGKRRTETVAQKKAAKTAFLRESCAQGNAIARDRSARQREERFVYTTWLATLSTAERAQARALGVGAYLPDHDSAPRSVVQGNREPDSDAVIHAEQGAGRHNGRPIAPRTHPVIDSAEPLESPGFDSFDPGEIAEAADTFGHVLRWALETPRLVSLGNRSAAAVACCRPDLAAALQIDRQLARALLATFHGPPGATLARLARAGAAFGRVFHWMLQGQSISANGERLLAVAYVLFPAFIDSKTLAEIGSETAKTRQAINKPVLDFRDKFPGIIARCQRPDSTRLLCQAAQTGKAA